MALGACLAFAALFLGATKSWEWARTTERFALHDVDFVGVEQTRLDELRRVAGLTPGRNLLALDLDEVERSLAEHPWVAEAEASRRLPHGLGVTLREHVPAAVAALGALYLVDAEGRPFKRLQPLESIDLPLVTGLSRERFLERPEEIETLIQGALFVGERYEAFRREQGWGEGHAISELRRERLSGSVTVVTRSEGELRLGRVDGPADDGRAALEERLERLARVRAGLVERGLSAKIIHLDNAARPEAITVRLGASSVN